MTAPRFIIDCEAKVAELSNLAQDSGALAVSDERSPKKNLISRFGDSDLAQGIAVASSTVGTAIGTLVLTASEAANALTLSALIAGALTPVILMVSADAMQFIDRKRNPQPSREDGRGPQRALQENLNAELDLWIQHHYGLSLYYGLPPGWQQKESTKVTLQHPSGALLDGKLFNVSPGRFELRKMQLNDPLESVYFGRVAPSIELTANRIPVAALTVERE